MTGVTHLVEALHHTILTFVARTKKPGRTRGLTGLVYRNIRSITELVGDGLDGLLLGLDKSFPAGDHSPRHQAIVAALNGVLGDHLLARNNPLAIPMQLRLEGKPVNSEELAAMVAQSGGNLLVLAHGLCMNWSAMVERVIITISCWPKR